MEPGQYFLLNYQLHDILWVHYLWSEKQVVMDCMLQIQNVKVLSCMLSTVRAQFVWTAVLSGNNGGSHGCACNMLMFSKRFNLINLRCGY